MCKSDRYNGKIIDIKKNTYTTSIINIKNYIKNTH